MGRPRSEFRSLLVSELSRGPGTSRQLAERTGIGRTATMYTLKNMVTAGEVSNSDRVRHPGVKRPVPVYAAAAIAPVTAPHLALVSAWSTLARTGKAASDEQSDS